MISTSLRSFFRAGLFAGILLIPASGSAGAADFWSHWGDGKAEIAAYDLVYPRYKELRRGRAVSIFVTETFSKEKMVKADPGRVEKADELLVIKQNLVKDFQTGIYDYNIQSSIFAAIEPFGGRPAGSPVKISFSSQEWCGNIYQELHPAGSVIRYETRSYFFGESHGEKTLDYPLDGILEDQLFLLVRGILGDYLAPGEKKEVPFLLSAERSRLTHTPPAWSRALIERKSNPKTIRVPAGSFETTHWIISPKKGPRLEFFVDRNFPHRVVLWKNSQGEKGELTGVTRVAYWRKTKEGDEKLLRPLGLGVPYHEP